MDWDSIDWDAMERLRGGFLEGPAGARGPACGDYWRSRSDLASYDQTFGQRIAWKWGFVLGELKRRGWRPPSGEPGVLDWGCGSGVAGRAFVGQFGAESVTGLTLWDRSPLAMEFAAGRAREEFAGLPVQCAPPGGGPIGTLLLSHVLTELSPRQIDELVALGGRATAVLWVEPGTHEASRALIACRERLRGNDCGGEGGFNILAPCTHQARCGLLAPGMERHWCHHFAASPPEIHTDGHWALFARIAGIDLRSLPLSFLALDKRPPGPALSLGVGGLDRPVRFIGRPRMLKAFALLFGCDETGVTERRLAKRAFPQYYRDLKRGRFQTLAAWQAEGDDITAVRPVLSDD